MSGGMNYSVDAEKSEKLQELLKKLPNQAEDLINDYLESKGSKNMMESIIGFIPVSRRNKKHAKSSKPFKATMHNLGFNIETKGGAAKNKGSFGYLVYPNEGRGPKNPIAQEFVERGMEKENDRIIQDLEEILTEKLL